MEEEELEDEKEMRNRKIGRYGREEEEDEEEGEDEDEMRMRMRMKKMKRKAIEESWR